MVLQSRAFGHATSVAEDGRIESCGDAWNAALMGSPFLLRGRVGGPDAHAAKPWLAVDHPLVCGAFGGTGSPGDRSDTVGGVG